jgi:organic hydroperoxide reductase OsmC/OhrA
MAEREHRYRIEVRWTGNQGVGTANYRSYARDHDIASPTAPGKPVIAGSSDPAFRGDPNRWNPEELFVAAISACHKLWYLHLCARAGIVVMSYLDEAEGIMSENEDGSGQFDSVTLRPRITITRAADLAKARDLHHDAHAKCFIANSINTPVMVEPVISAQDEPKR